jgi:hypothetical protein
MLAVLACWIIAPFALIYLARKRHYLSVVLTLCFAIAYPVLFKWLSRINDPETRLWVGLPIVFLFPLYFLLGVFVVVKAWSVVQGEEWPPANERATGIAPTRRRWKWAVLIAIGGAVWLLGIWRPDVRAGNQGTLGALVMSFILVGLFWLYSGRGLFEPEVDKRTVGTGRPPA